MENRRVIVFFKKKARKILTDFTATANYPLPLWLTQERRDKYWDIVNNTLKRKPAECEEVLGVLRYYVENYCANNDLDTPKLRRLTKVIKKYIKLYNTSITSARYSRYKGHYPYHKSTDVLKELLERGFVHRDDFPPVRPCLPTGCYQVASTRFGLVYPKNFLFHQDAIKFCTKLGITNYTGCPIPK